LHAPFSERERNHVEKYFSSCPFKCIGVQRDQWYIIYVSDNQMCGCRILPGRHTHARARACYKYKI